MISLNTVCDMGNENKIIGCQPVLDKSEITFLGKNNILFCEENVELVDSELHFSGDNGIIWLGSNRNKYKLSVTIFSNCVFHMGKDNYINGKMSVILSEQKHCYIGEAGIISFNVGIRNADPHLIYSCSTGKRINESKSVYIGDHVWIGQDVRILKGTQVDSGSIIGAMSVVAGKKIGHNSTWAGNPCRLLNNDVFWDIACVHNWTDVETEKSMLYADYISEYKIGCKPDYWVYKYDESECIKWSELEKHFSAELTPMEKIEYLFELDQSKKKNRFVHKY